MGQVLLGCATTTEAIRRGRKTRSPRMDINDTKKRIQAEVESMRGMAWITDGREIENYIPKAVLERIVGNGSCSAGIYDDMPAHPYLSKFRGNKIEIAHAVTVALKADDLEHLDLT